VGDHSAGKLENPANTVFEQLRNDEIGNFTDGIDKRSLYLEISLLKSTPKPTSETLVPIVLMSLRDVQKTCNTVTPYAKSLHAQFDAMIKVFK
jgi:hypothetical protein